MNSRIEGGSTLSRTDIIASLESWCRGEEVELSDDTKAYFFDGIEEAKPEGADRYISYYGDDGCMEYERKVYFPEADTLEAFRERFITDDKVKEHLNPDAVAEFIYNCIDMNALCCVQHIALLYDEPVLDEDGEVEEWKETKGRRELMDKASDGCDEYAFEVGLETLGINWVERSAVIINVSELLKSSEEIAKDIYGENWESFADSIFREGLVQTICHEFRHAFYELNEMIPYDAERYPKDGGLEADVEQYGNREAERLMMNKDAMKYISAMFETGQPERKHHKEKER